MESDKIWAIILLLVITTLAMFVCVSFVKYKQETERQILEYFSQCVKINEEKIQCPIPK